MKIIFGNTGHWIDLNPDLIKSISITLKDLLESLPESNEIEIPGATVDDFEIFTRVLIPLYFSDDVKTPLSLTGVIKRFQLSKIYMGEEIVEILYRLVDFLYSPKFIVERLLSLFRENPNIFDLLIRVCSRDNDIVTRFFQAYPTQEPLEYLFYSLRPDLNVTCLQDAYIKSNISKFFLIRIQNIKSNNNFRKIDEDLYIGRKLHPEYKLPVLIPVDLNISSIPIPEDPIDYRFVPLRYKYWSVKPETIEKYLNEMESYYPDKSYPHVFKFKGVTVIKEHPYDIYKAFKEKGPELKVGTLYIPSTNIDKVTIS